ncbi:hypothetical protein ACEWY4_023180 [Coilia grayii]|uniref:Gypsy retrotransposon integrase-like protein 1 n=1 Tax=Coilia grayii TaxID=363190 RepID=A0ABD1J2K8_9TELE
MTEFSAREFLGEDVSRGRLTKLTKQELVRVFEFIEIEYTEELKKIQLIDCLAVHLGLKHERTAEIRREKARQAEEVCREKERTHEARQREQQRLFEAEQREREAEKREKDLQIELQVANVKLEQTKRDGQDRQRQREHEVRFDVSKCLKIMPRFCPESPDVFFEAFERIATEREWPVEEWVTLIRRELTGKGQEAYTSLAFGDSCEYETVKRAVLRAYDLVPEAYRQQFRHAKLSPGQSYVDFARQQELTFDKWLRASEVYTFQDLRKLIILEQFKNSVSRPIEVHLNEQQVKEQRKAAEMADNYVLVHRESWREFSQSSQLQSRSTVKEASADKSSRMSNPGVMICHYCKKPGHIKSRCRLLASRGQNGLHQPVSLVSTECKQDAPFGQELNCRSLGVDSDMFKNFVSEGSVAPREGESEVSVTILRDTGAAQSLIVSSLLPLSEDTSLKASVLLRGLGGEYGAVPLHRVFLKSSLVTGYVTVGVVPVLPVEGADLLMGNDLAGSQVCVAPMVSLVPCESPDMVALEQECPEFFPACVVTRSQARQKERSSELSDQPVELSDTFFAVLDGLPDAQQYNREALIAGQKSDPDLAVLRSSAASFEESRVMAQGFYLREEVLMRKWRPADRPATEVWSIVDQVVLPPSFRPEVLRLAHETSMAGHLGIRKTQDKILKHFYWPQLHKDVVALCRSCHACQLVGKPNQAILPAPLCPLPVVEEPFSHVMIDCVGPLPKTKKGNEYLLTIYDVATRFPEAVPLKNIKARPVLEALICFFSRFGLPKRVQSDRGSNFVSGVFQEVLAELGIEQVTSSPYHPQSQGAIERYHQTLKTMMKAYSIQHPGDWDAALPLLLFALRDSVSEATGFTPFELVFGHEVRGPLRIVKERLIRESSEGNVLQYVATFRDRLATACHVAQENLKGAKVRMKAQYDKRAVERSFQPGDRVLVLLPMRGSGLSTKFCGPYTIERRVGDRNYVINTPDRRTKSRLCHINLLKPYLDRTGQPTTTVMCVVSEGPEVPDEMVAVEPISAHLGNSMALSNLSHAIGHLTDAQQRDMESLVKDFVVLFKDIPGRTTVAVHDVETGDAVPIKQHPYRLSPGKLKQMDEELKYMLEIGVVEPGQSDWSSPVVLVPKADGSVRFCIDYRQVNKVTKTDAFPIPRLEDCIDRIGQAQFVTKLDLLKGYWQVPLTPRAQEVSAFVTPTGLYRCTALPFGMKNSPATFQRAMNSITAGLSNVVTYIDDVVTYSLSWPEHVNHLRELFQRLQQANLVINLPKCEFGKGQVTYLGHKVGQGMVAPRQAKVQAIVGLETPRTRRELMRILGMCGFYRRFVPNFAAVTEPLTSLLRKDVRFRWSDQCQSAFDRLKAILSCEPVLRVPDFDIPFKLAVDACEVGIGAVLLQTDDQGFDRPVAYFSKKLDKHQRAYSTIEKEALALVLAVRHFEIYISSSGGEVVVLTDHNPLTFVAKFKTSNARVFRWSLILQPYNLVVQHVAGKENVIADTLSRA